MPNQFEIVSYSPEQTQQIGFAIGELAQPNNLILLAGNLGAGKTCLTQGIARGAGFEGYASSPSFVLVKEYQGRLALYHIDLYRLDDVEEIDELGLEDYLNGEGFCVIEWADKALESLSPEHLLIIFEYLSENERRLRFEPIGKRYVDLLSELKIKWNLQ
ncbi:MAG: tRNA (adenosine(37)-N6)-threonylcarbamoyltransferase complex ATPase subunit type 1 TsaE [Chloroflexota bacterium]|nr:tRNA (adenosine(37)-N6)-threonylcarbamoyltransferase complex ATPase subunit type 1 TsaE [Chloroflexota bacterium]